MSISLFDPATFLFLGALLGALNFRVTLRGYPNADFIAPAVALAFCLLVIVIVRPVGGSVVAALASLGGATLALGILLVVRRFTSKKAH